MLRVGRQKSGANQNSVVAIKMEPGEVKLEPKVENVSMVVGVKQEPKVENGGMVVAIKQEPKVEIGELTPPPTPSPPHYQGLHQSLPQSLPYGTNPLVVRKGRKTPPSSSTSCEVISTTPTGSLSLQARRSLTPMRVETPTNTGLKRKADGE